MSDILIKGMEIPTIEMEWTIRHGVDGKWYAIDTNAETTDGEWHEIVPVPPHGRCIDVDALEDNNITYYAIPVLKNVTDGAIREAELVIRLKDLDAAPTVIPTSEED